MLHLRRPRLWWTMFISKSYLNTWPSFKVEIDSRMGILCEQLLGERISNTLPSLTKFHPCVEAQPGDWHTLFPGHQWHDASRPMAGMSLVPEKLITKTCLPVLMIPPHWGVDPEGWSSIDYSSVSCMFLTSSNQYQTDTIKFSFHILPW